MKQQIRRTAGTVFRALPMPLRLRTWLRQRIHAGLRPGAHEPADVSNAAVLEAAHAVRVTQPGSVRPGALRFDETPAPVVSIIVAAFNHLDYTLNCLGALPFGCGQIPFEVVVVDDCSTDATPEVVPAIPGIGYVRTRDNGGFVLACNQGAGRARGRYLVFLNNDTVVQGGWLEALVATAATEPRAGLVGSQLLNPDGTLQEAGCAVWRDGTGLNYGRGGDRRRPEFNHLRATGYCSAASILVPAALFRDIGGFDEAFAPAYYEDTDLAFQVRKRGWRVLYQPLSRVVHFEGVTSGTSLDHGTKQYQARNRTVFVGKWHRELARRPERLRAAVLPDEECHSRVLVLDAGTPRPDRDSGSVDAFFLMKILRSLGCAVTFLPEDLAYLERYTPDLQRIGVECIYAPYARDPLHFLRERGRDYDCVFLTRFTVAERWLDAARRCCREAQLAVILVDLHYLRAEREAEVTGSVQARRQAAEARLRELDVVRRADLTIVKSLEEQRLLAQEAAGKKTFLLPLIMDAPGRQARAFEERRDFLFLGGFAHAPNVDAVLYLVRDIWPRVRAALPEARLRIVGSDMPDAIRALSAPGVDIAGHVPDLAECMNGTRVMVAPLRYGAGVKGKIGRAVGYGMPCVATPLAVEGMGLQDGMQVIVAETPDDFADRCIETYSDAQLWTKLSENGLLYFEEALSVAAGTARIAQLLRELGIDTMENGLCAAQSPARSA